MGLTYDFRTTFSMLCGVLCGERRAVKYTFNSNTNKCTLYGEGYGTASSTNTFLMFPSQDSLEDVATGKPASASSVYLQVSSNNSSSVADSQPWWLLDLGETRVIHEVQILPRRNCCPFRFHDIEIRIGDVQPANGNFSSFTPFSTYKGPYSAALGRLSCARGDGLSGRFVVIIKVIPGDQYVLQVADVNIFVQK
ncbi:hypothetical protein O3P69_020732 [Scylla paramamosain]|uniref:Fucolectin tachylectin-4 pentraxin-1 domain-containing protein n=1 Tax=Scylla paramamosain TaxID=85552 RepID=A0AAW0TPG4_SCYPA